MTLTHRRAIIYPDKLPVSPYPQGKAGLGEKHMNFEAKIRLLEEVFAPFADRCFHCTPIPRWLEGKETSPEEWERRIQRLIRKHKEKQIRVLQAFDEVGIEKEEVEREYWNAMSYGSSRRSIYDGECASTPHLLEAAKTVLRAMEPI